MLSVLAFARILQGDLVAGLEPVNHSIEIARRIGNVLTVGYGLGWKGIATFMLGQWEDGIQMMKEGGELIEATGSHLTLTLVYGWLAESCAASGDVEDAVLYAGKVLERGLVLDKIGEVMARRALAVAASLEIPPDWGKVEDHMEESIRISAERGEKPNLAIGYYRYSGLLQKKGDPERAREQLDQATALFREMEMDWWSEQAEVLLRELERQAISP
jgi:tetratricopeptide (TPR) repeat protein